ncbi:MAG: hypothetical protein ACE5Q6_09645, partial [Dehalococcoidia bacterium]
DSGALMSLALLEYETGNFSQGEAYLVRLLEIVSQLPPSSVGAYIWAAIGIPYAARISGTPVRLSEAAEAARMVLSSPLATVVHTTAAQCGLGLQAIVQGDAQAAAEQYTALEVVQGILVPFYLASDRILGLLAHTMGELDKAAEHFEDSLTFCQKAGYRPQLAWSCCDYADTLLQRASAGSAQAHPGDRERAMSLLEESLALSTELGMRPLMERVLSRRDILKA